MLFLLLSLSYLSHIRELGTFSSIIAKLLIHVLGMTFSFLLSLHQFRHVMASFDALLSSLLINLMYLRVLAFVFYRF